MGRRLKFSTAEASPKAIPKSSVKSQVAVAVDQTAMKQARRPAGLTGHSRYASGISSVESTGSKSHGMHPSVGEAGGSEHPSASQALTKQLAACAGQSVEVVKMVSVSLDALF